MGTYQSDRSSVNFNKVPVSGFAPGTFINCEFRVPPVTVPEAGPDGETCFVTHGDNTATVTITLKRSSRSIEDLHGFYVASRNGAPVVGELSVLCQSTGSRLDSRQAMITNFPGISREKEDIGNVEIEFTCLQAKEVQKGFTS